jgi:hypothetical protein
MRARFAQWLVLTVVLAVPIVNAGAQAPGPAVAITSFTGRTSDPHVPKAVSAMLLTDMLATLKAHCDGQVLEWEHRSEAIREIELGQTPLVDPAVALQPGHLLQPDVMITGTITEDAAGGFSWSVEGTTVVGNEVIATSSGTSADGDLLAVVSTVAEGMAEQICKKPAGYAISGRMDEGTITGTICGTLDKPFTAVSPEVAGSWKFTPSSATAGTFSYEAKNVGGVRGAGSGTYTIVAGQNDSRRMQLAGTGTIYSPVGNFSAQITEAFALAPVKTCGRVGTK